MSKNIDDMLYSLINSDYEKWKTRFNFHIRGTYNSYYSFDNKIKQMYLIALILSFDKCDNKNYFVELLLSSITELDSLIEIEKQKIDNKNDYFFEDWKNDLIKICDKIIDNENDVHKKANYMVLKDSLSKKGIKELKTIFKGPLYNPFEDKKDILNKMSKNTYNEDIFNNELNKLNFKEIDIPLDMQISVIKREINKAEVIVNKRKKFDDNSLYFEDIKNYLKDKLTFSSFDNHKKLIEYLYKVAVILKYKVNDPILSNQFIYYLYQYELSYNKLLSNEWVDPLEFKAWKNNLSHNSYYKKLEDKYPEMSRNISRRLNDRYEHIIRQLVNIKQFDSIDITHNEDILLSSEQIDKLYYKVKIYRMHAFIDSNNITVEQLNDYPDIINPIYSIDKFDDNMVLELEVYSLIEKTIDRFKVKKVKTKER